MYRFHISEDKGKIYDSALMARLMRYARPYAVIFAVAGVLLLAATAFQVILPYIMKTAIDRYIVPQYVKIIVPEGVEIKGYRISGDTMLVNLSELPRGQKIKVEKLKLTVSPEKYIVVRDSAAIESVVKRHPKMFERVEGIGFIMPVSKVKLLSPSERRTLRARDWNGVIKMTGIYLLLLVLNFIFSFAQAYALNSAGQKIMYDMRKDIFAHMMRLPVPFFDKNPVGRLVTRATNDVAAINQMYTNVLVYFFRDLLLAIAIFAIMMKMNLKLSLVVLSLVPILVLMTAVFQAKVRQVFREIRRLLAKLNAFLQEHLSGIEVVHLMGAEDYTKRRFSEINKGYFKATIKQIYVFGTFRPGVELLRSIGLALVLWYGGGQVIRHALSFGALVAFVSYVEMFFRPIIELADKFNIMQGAMAAAERIFKLMDEPQEHYEGEKLPEVVGSVKFEDVWFAYVDEEWVLKGINFDVKPGEVFAIVGPTGSGKTSIINILLRFYDIQKGKVLLDGVDIRKLDLRFLRRQMALVLQDVFIFSGKIKDNIRLREDSIDDEQVRQAAQYVYAHEFIERLPEGYDTELGERGLNISMGQRQLLSFARAVAFKPKILILDEATSSVDSETEHLIQLAVKKLLEGRTSIVIAHRLSTIRDADWIIVLYNGKIIEEGRHQDLMAKRGFYYYLYTLQLGVTANNGSPN